MDQFTRRQFLDRSAAGLTALGLASAADAQAAERKYRLAFMGVNDRGRQLVSLFCKFPEVEVAYICDPDSAVVGRAVKAAIDSGRKPPRVLKDFRTALDDPSVDALVCAAPDHWHALATILACQAGKDVYVEKPASHRLLEGRRMVEAARKYDCVVQVGTQRRSGADFQAAARLIREGRLGKVGVARAWADKIRPSVGRVPVSAPPPNLDFDLWCGPAPNNGYQSNLVHYHWHWRWDYGTGESGNLGAHSLDVARWCLGVEYPRLVCSGGGKYVFDDDKETPDTQFATFDFDGVTIQWEHRMWASRAPEGNQRWGVAFYGTDATLIADSSGWELYRGKELIDSHDKFDCQTAHVANFLECLASRERPNADIEIGHRSAALAHLANIALRTRSTIRFDADTESIVGNDEANSLLSGIYRPGFELPKV